MRDCTIPDIEIIHPGAGHNMRDCILRMDGREIKGCKSFSYTFDAQGGTTITLELMANVNIITKDTIDELLLDEDNA